MKIKNFKGIGKKVIDLLTETTLDEKINKDFFGGFQIDYLHKGDFSDIRGLVIRFNLAFSINGGTISVAKDGKKVLIHPTYKIWQDNIKKNKKDLFSQYVYSSIDKLLRKEGFSYKEGFSVNKFDKFQEVNGGLYKKR